MSILDSVKGWLATVDEGSTPSTNKGAYWCDDCAVRLRETDIASEQPQCPDCGGEMRFERSMQGVHCC